MHQRIRRNSVANQSDRLSRTILPIGDAKHVGLTTYDAKDPDTKFPPIEPLRPPKGAPNVLIVLLDDVGFAASSAFGGVISTPTAERLAKGGLKFNRFHTTALCSPTRQAMLTGRNHHSVNMAGICELATSAPGYTSLLPKDKAPLAMTLKLNGYSTAQFGKCHEVPVWETSPMGPFDQWPSGGGGFEYFYGFIGGETNQYYPAIYEGTTPIEPPKTPAEGYHFTEDMTDKAIKWVRQQKALMPDKPFFMYFAPGASMPRTTYRRNGSTSTRASSTRAGTSCVRRSSPGRRSSRSYRAMPSSPSDPRRFRRGTKCRRS
jgi:arylsulfatase